MIISQLLRLSQSACLLVALLLAAYPASAQTIIPRAPQVNASSYILMDAETGHIIVEENADEALPPASLTKIMTAYIAEEEIQNGNLAPDELVHISEKAWRMEGSKMFVEVDSQVRVQDLLRGIIIQSGNDASVAIAEHIAGSEDAFADMMNQYAEVLGLQNSFFMNASGLDTETYYNRMSARDLAKLARATVRNHPEFYPINAEREFTYNGITQMNRNSLLFRDRNVDGLKTGWTDAAGYCLVASAQRDGMRLISVVMGTASEDARAVETQKLLTYGFRYFETHNLYQANQVLTNVPVYYGDRESVDLAIPEAVTLTIPRGQAESMEASIDIAELIEAPVEQGQVMGTVSVVLDGEIIYRGSVVAVQPVAEAGMFKQFTDWLNLSFQNLFSD